MRKQILTHVRGFNKIFLLSLWFTFSVPFMMGHAMDTGERNILVLWNSKAIGAEALNQQSFYSALECMGFRPAHIAVDSFVVQHIDKNTLLIIPHTSAVSLSPSCIQYVVKKLREGLILITDGESALSDAVGIRLGDPIRIGNIVFQRDSGQSIFWSDTPAVRFITHTTDPKATIHYFDQDSRRPLVAQMRFGQGWCLYFAPLFDPISGHGYSRFPHLLSLIISGLHFEPQFTRRAADAYFDPGFRYDIAIDKLARRWKEWGIQTIHAAAWYSADESPYDYAQLVRACHQNGILVYAWLQWPYVGRGFWDAHPEWRQKNALLQDAKLDFLYLMDLQNPACMKAAMNDLKSLLVLDWDGIDVAEFSITGGVAEALEGPAQPKFFTGFTEVARNEFQKKYRFDPLELFDSTSQHFWKTNSVALNTFYNYRVDVNNRLLKYIIDELTVLKLAQNRDWEIILTIIDNSRHPEFNRLLGYDQEHTLELVKKHHLTLNVEDPLSEWNNPPDRYKDTGAAYRKLLGDHPLMMDINVVRIHPKTHKSYCTQQQTGTELCQLIRNVLTYTHRVCLYSEWTVFGKDWEMIPFVCAADARARKDGNEWIITTSHTLLWKRSQKGVRPLLDGTQWYCFSKEGIVIPKGNHRLKFMRTVNRRDETQFRVLSISGEILNCTTFSGTLQLEYSSQQRCVIEINRKPTTMLVNDRESTLPVFKNRDRVILLAPSGRHRLTLKK